MANITIKNIPEAVIARLKKKAKENQRSLNSEIIFFLTEATMKTSHRDVRQLLGDVEKAQRMNKGMLTAAEIEKAIAEGRE